MRWPGVAPRLRPRAANDEGIPAPSTRKLDVDLRLLELAMARHAEIDDNDTVAVWLDLETGAVLWLYAHDEDEAGACADDVEPCCRMREIVRSNPSRYVVVPAHTRDAHRSLLTAFLKTRWTGHEPERLAALERYRGSLGAWIADSRNRYALQAFRAFRTWHFTELATALLREHGIEST